MWFFMNSCYILSLLTFAVLIMALFQNIFYFSVFNANHITFIILVSILYLFTETLVIFFFVGTGVSIKEFTHQNKLKPDYHRSSLQIKRKVYPPLLLNILFMIILFVLVGAVDTGKVPAGVFRIYFVFCIAHFIYSKIIQNECFRKNTDVILEMSGIKRGVC